MSQCKVCNKLLCENPREFFNYEGPFGYKVIAKVGKLSYRCSCNRCGHIWLTRSADAKFQHDEPQKYSRYREGVEKMAAKITLEKKQGYTILVYSKLIMPIE